MVFENIQVADLWDTALPAALIAGVPFAGDIPSERPIEHRKDGVSARLLLLLEIFFVEKERLVPALTTPLIRADSLNSENAQASTQEGILRQACTILHRD